MKSGSGGDCDFPVDPLLSPPNARVLWLPQDDTSIIALGEAPPYFSAGAEPGPALDTAFAVGGDRETFLLYALGNGQSIQLVRTETAASGTHVAALVPLTLEGFDRIESISRLLAGLHGRAIPPDTRLTHQQRARLRRMLQCFDGHRDGATQQEIAQILFRIGPLGRDDWQASSARHAIKSLLRDARAMIAGGYRTLLRHSRRA